MVRKREKRMFCVSHLVLLPHAQVRVSCCLPLLRLWLSRPSTLNPQPSTLNPQPFPLLRLRLPRPSTLNPQPFPLLWLPRPRPRSGAEDEVPVQIRLQNANNHALSHAHALSLWLARSRSRSLQREEIVDELDRIEDPKADPPAA